MGKFAKLRTYNFWMGVFHLIQGILMLSLSTDFALPVIGNFLEFNPATQSLSPYIKTLFEIPIGPAVALFLFMSSSAHFILTLPRVFDWYVRNLKKGINYARWIEYTFSSSVMIVIIAMLVGIYEFSSLISMFGLNAMMILFGLIMEVHNQTTKKTNWLSFIFGSIAGILPWVNIALYLGSYIGKEASPPDFVYWIFVSIFVFFNCFAINMVLQYKKIGKWKDYTFGEKVYIFLSLFAKSALAWQVWAGTLRPN
ncbi:heliorhodopsin HeR [Candidatus Dojkabacteria bacterium]|nr:heliorhodopsin HeR [Candidatus Dojkabacteria bacterium]